MNIRNISTSYFKESNGYKIIVWIINVKIPFPLPLCLMYLVKDLI